MRVMGDGEEGGKGQDKLGDCAMLLLLRLARCCRRPSLLSRIGLNEDLKRGLPITKEDEGWSGCAATRTDQLLRKNPRLR